MSNQIFDYEKDMHSWLREKLKFSDLCSLILDYDKGFPTISNAPDWYNTISTVYESCFDSLFNHQIICDDRNILASNLKGLKPDFLLYAVETQDIIIIELKNSKTATRQAGTELCAYNNELENILPYNSGVVNIIISQHWPTLMSQQIYNDIIYHNKRIVCLEPTRVKSKIKLKFVFPFDVIEHYTFERVDVDALTGFDLEFEDHQLYQGGKNGRLDKHINQFDTIISAMVRQAEKQNSHGFAFLWKHKEKDSISPFIATIVEISSFGLLNERLNNVESGIGPALEFIDKEYDPRHGKALYSKADFIKNKTGNICSPMVNNSNYWRALKSNMLIESDEILSFYSWGIIRDAHDEFLLKKYNQGQYNLIKDNSEVGLELIDYITEIKSHPDWELWGY